MPHGLADFYNFCVANRYLLSLRITSVVPMVGKHLFFIDAPSNKGHDIVKN